MRSNHSAFRIPHSAFLSFLLLLLALASVRAADFEAGVARVKITPPMPFWMSGYAARTTQSLGITRDLWAKALALRDDQGRRAVIVTTDLIGLPGDLSTEVFARAQTQFGLKRPEVMLTCTHTHYGPVVGENLSVMFDFNPADKERVRAYAARLTDDLIGVIGAALKDLAPARLTVGHGVASFSANRRQHTGGNFKIGVNPDGPVDRDVPVLQVADLDGRPRAIFFGYACHNTTICAPAREFYMISGDYAGEAAAALERQFPGATAMFTILCGADQNSYPRGTLELSRQYGQALAGEVARVLKTELRPVNPPIRTAGMSAVLDFAPHTRQTFEEELRKNEGVKNGDKFRARRAKLMLEAYDRGEPVERIHYPVQAIRLGRDFTILALGGEVVVDYALRVKKEFPGENLMVIGYANEVMCYIPNRRILREGGYEPDTSMVYYGQPGPFAENVEEKVMGGIYKTLKKVGTK